MTQRKRLRITVTGIVQGVGFRPFVYRIAREHSLGGWVRNDQSGVTCEIEGDPFAVDCFLDDLAHKRPSISVIETLTSEPVDPLGTTDFTIEASLPTELAPAELSPDLATCPDCLRELQSPSDRRYRYPFLNCTNCGPRFSIIREVPYDRARTTMAGFTMCERCAKEYADPLDRRFHAEPTACPDCGPRLSFVQFNEQTEESGEEGLSRAAERIRQGGIIAVKGIGGYHLCCDALNPLSIKLLRDRKHRPSKPFGIMFADLAVLRDHCEVSDAEVEFLQSPRRPILLLKRRGDSTLPTEIAPGIREIGAFLPYTPLHNLLFEATGLPALVMTSGNRSEEPIVADDSDLAPKLSGIADAALTHDRPIWNRNDDSVGYVRGKSLVLTRRSRGFAPTPVRLSQDVPSLLALGAMYCNTFTLAEGRRAFLSQHIGDVDNEETLSFLREAVDRFRNWLRIDPVAIVCDLHPDLLTSRLAEEIAGELPVIRVQHHKAHLASVVASHRCEEPVLGLVCDGTGYGEDGTIWGGEFLLDDGREISRVGRLKPMPLPGGDAAIKRPIRTAIAYLFEALPELDPSSLLGWEGVDKAEVEIVLQMVERRFNTISTSSVGRLFDAVSAILGVCRLNTYEGEAAILLEQAARGDEILHFVQDDKAEVQDDNEGLLELDPAPLIRVVVEEVIAEFPRSVIARHFHNSLADSLASAGVNLARRFGVRKVALAGGVFQNRLLTDRLSRRVCDEGLDVLLPNEIPVNDGGISLGQIVLAGRMLQ